MNSSVGEKSPGRMRYKRYMREARSQQQNTEERVIALDMLRGTLALSVAAYHFFVVTHPFTGWARDVVVVTGIYAVQIFFILSGFCFFHLYAGTPRAASTWPRFYIKRFFRIAPLYYVAVACSGMLDPPVYPHPEPRTIAENLTLSFGLFHPNHAMVPGGWSIGIEVVFYLALPVLLWLARPTGALHVLTVLLTALAVPFTFDKVESAHALQRFHLYVQVPNHAFLFLLGGIVADIRRRTSMRLPAVAALVPIGLFLVAVSQMPSFQDHLEVMVGLPRVLYVMLSFVVVLVVALLRTPQAQLWRPLGVLGDWSYSVYLVHPFAWVLVHRLRHVLSPSAQLIAGLLTTLLIAALTHRYVERPANALGRRLAHGKRRLRTQHFDLGANAQQTERAMH